MGGIFPVKPIKPIGAQPQIPEMIAEDIAYKIISEVIIAIIIVKPQIW